MSRLRLWITGVPAFSGALLRRRGVRLILCLLVVLWASRVAATVVTDAQWHDSLGYGDVWRARLLAQIALFWAMALCSFALAALPLCALTRGLHASPALLPPYDAVANRIIAFNRGAARGAWMLAAVAALLAARHVSAGWQDWLLFRHGDDFGARDPYWGRDLGLYIFRLGWWRRLLDAAWLVCSLSLASTIALGLGRAALLSLASTADGNGDAARIAVLRCVAGVGAAWFALRAMGYVLTPLEAATAQHPQEAQEALAAGLRSFDWNVARPLCWTGGTLCGVAACALTGCAIRTNACAVWLRRGPWRAARRIAAAGVVVLLPALLLRLTAFGHGLIAPLADVLPVAPQQGFLERAHRHATRAAWRLNAIHEPRRPAPQPSQNGRDAGWRELPLHIVRVWDEKHLTQAARSPIGAPPEIGAMQLDRYEIAGRTHLVGIAAHTVGGGTGGDEAAPAQGILVYSATAVASDGQPVALSGGSQNKGAQPMSRLFALREPRLFYGQGSQPHALRADAAAGGVELGSWGQRALWAWRLGDASLLRLPLRIGGAARASQAGDETAHLLFRRSIVERARVLAPFLLPDGEACPVVHEGRVVWMLNLLSATARYPGALDAGRVLQAPASALRGCNAARDSVKMVMDAVTGAVRFYAASDDAERDPMLRVWRRAFPTLIRPLREMPPALRRHRRYPRTLFSAQLEILRRYGAPPVPDGARSIGDYRAAGKTPVDEEGLEQGAAGYALLPGATSAATPRFVLQTWATMPDAATLVQVTASCDESDYGRLSVSRFDGETGGSRARRHLDALRADVRLKARNRLRETLRSEALRRAKGQQFVRGDALFVAHPVGAQAALFEPWYAVNERAVRLRSVIVIRAPTSNGVRPGNINSSEGDVRVLSLQQWLRLRGRTLPVRSKRSETARPRTTASLAHEALRTHDEALQAARRGDWKQADAQWKRHRALLQQLKARSEKQAGGG